MQEQAACLVAQKADDIGVCFYLDFGFMHDLTSDYSQPEVK
jgi:hypothetical protein